MTYGIRAGGGIGDVLRQPQETDDLFYARSIFDFVFFMVVNIILMNIFFGIIIDSFADKRAMDEVNR
jgi:inositol 1,4,5-triphosphate receptor type 1